MQAAAPVVSREVETLPPRQSGFWHGSQSVAQQHDAVRSVTPVGMTMANAVSRFWVDYPRGFPDRQYPAISEKTLITRWCCSPSAVSHPARHGRFPAITVQLLALPSGAGLARP